MRRRLIYFYSDEKKTKGNIGRTLIERIFRLLY